MKLLALEEIEDIQRYAEYLEYPDCTPAITYVKVLGSDYDGLIATARAYIHTFNILKENIPRMRQWLNEDRITDVQRLVDNEDISFWLLNVPLPDGESLPSGGGFTPEEEEKIIKFLGSKQ